MPAIPVPRPPDHPLADDDLETGDDGLPRFARPLHVGGPNMGSREAFDRYVDDIWAARRLSNDGPLVQRLEARVAALAGVRHCVAMTNGTVALEIAARALDMSGEVVVPSYTFVATAHALSWQGITPVFADIDERTHLVDPAAVRRMVTPRTTGIVGVHLWGRAAPVEALEEIAAEHGLALMFDAAHAFGASHGPRMVGSLGRAEVFSFHATKFFNTFEGGAVVTDDDELAERLRLMRNFGFRGFDNVVDPGTNGKMTEVCAAMGLVNLDHLDAFVAHNRSVFEAYQQALADVPHTRLLPFPEGSRHNYQYVVVEVDDGDPGLRDRVVATLQARGVLARRYFWPACHRMEPYRSLQPHAGLLLPNTQRVAERVVVLPTGSALTPRRAHAVAEILASVVDPAARRRPRPAARPAPRPDTLQESTR